MRQRSVLHGLARSLGALAAGDSTKNGWIAASVDNQALGKVATPYTKGWWLFETVEMRNKAIIDGPGSHLLEFEIKGSGYFNIDYFTLTLESTSSPNAKVGDIVLIEAEAPTSSVDMELRDYGYTARSGTDIFVHDEPSSGVALPGEVVGRTRNGEILRYEVDALAPGTSQATAPRTAGSPRASTTSRSGKSPRPTPAAGGSSTPSQ